jgi:hypothetical protein
MTVGRHEFVPFSDDRWQLDTAAWRGISNGLPALRWAPILDVQAALVPALLAALGSQGIPSRAEPPSGLRSRRTRPARWHLFVDAVGYAHAEDVLRVELAVLRGNIRRR